MNDSFDWMKFILHFCFGLILGGVICIPWTYPLYAFGVTLTVALLGGLFGDRFWRWLMTWF